MGIKPVKYYIFEPDKGTEQGIKVEETISPNIILEPDIFVEQKEELEKGFRYVSDVFIKQDSGKDYKPILDEKVDIETLNLPDLKVTTDLTKVEKTKPKPITVPGVSTGMFDLYTPEPPIPIVPVTGFFKTPSLLSGFGSRKKKKKKSYREFGTLDLLGSKKRKKQKSALNFLWGIQNDKNR